MKQTMQFTVFCALLFAFISSGFCQNLTKEQIEEQNNCKCVNYFLCTDENFIISDGAGLIEPRLGDNIERIYCPNPVQFCCKLKGTVNPDTPTTKKPTTREPPIHTKITDVTCGIQRPGLDIRFQSNELGSTLEGEFPWAAAIFRNNKFRCTGALIHPKVVLTVAHYVQRSETKKYKVVVNGKTYFNHSKAEDERTVADVIRHPDFYSGGLHNDIALLILNEPFNLSHDGPRINKVCIPPSDTDFGGVICIAAGWNNKGISPLQKIVVPMVPHDKCQDKLRETHLGEFYELHSSFTCAGGVKGVDACSGDGGSPLTCAVDEVHYLVGLVSFGVGCGKEGIPGVYTDIGLFREWIEEELKKQNIDITVD